MSAADKYTPEQLAAYRALASNDWPTVAKIASERAVHPYERDEKTSFTWANTSEIFAELPETKWIVPGLHVCPGRAGMVAAYGNTGKTLALQTASVEMTVGLPIWGRFDVPRPMKVRTFDYEQGKHATFKRFQRIAKGLSIEPRDLGDRLDVTIFPSIYLNTPGAEDAYARALEGVDFAFLDALKGATPGEDENDSKIRSCIDVLTRASDKTGCAIWLIHHSGKPKEGHADMRTIARGSSAIFDACGSVFMMVGEKGQPKLMSHQKLAPEAEGSTLDDFHLAIVDVERDGNPTAGVRVVVTDAPKRAADPSAQFDETISRVRECIRRNPDIAGVNAIRERVSLHKSKVSAALDELADEIVNLGTKARPRLRLR